MIYIYTYIFMYNSVVVFVFLSTVDSIIYIMESTVDNYEERKNTK